MGTTNDTAYTMRRQHRANTPLERFELHMRARGLSDRTIGQRLLTIPRVADGRPPEDIDAVTVSRFLADRNLSQSSRCTYWSELSAWFRFLIDEGVRDDYPMPPRPRQPVRYARPVPATHVARLVAAPRLHHRTRVMILLAVYAGLRVHEIAQVHGRDVDPVAATIVVDGKGGSRHVMPMHPVLVEAARTMPVDGYWFPRCTPGVGHDQTRHMAGKSVSDVIGRAMRRHQVPGTPHGLRHHFATALIEANVNVRIVQELLRHKSLQSTQIYTAVSDVQRRAGINALTTYGVIS